MNELKFKSIEIQANGNYFEFLAQEIRRINTVSYKYSNRKTNFLIKLAINTVLNFLKHSSTNDKGSEELLNFGYNVISIKA